MMQPPQDGKQPVRVHCALLSLWDSERRFMIQCWRAWGADHQFNQCMEECAELIVALNHYRRTKDRNMLRINRLKVIEEVVDTINMGYEVLTILDVTGEEYNEMWMQKLNRLKDTYRQWLDEQAAGGKP